MARLRQNLPALSFPDIHLPELIHIPELVLFPELILFLDQLCLSKVKLHLIPQLGSNEDG